MPGAVLAAKVVIITAAILVSPTPAPWSTIPTVLRPLWIILPTVLVLPTIPAPSTAIGPRYAVAHSTGQFHGPSVFGFIPGCRPRTQENTAKTLLSKGLRRFPESFLIPTKPRKTLVSGVLYTLG